MSLLSSATGWFHRAQPDRYPQAQYSQLAATQDTDGSPLLNSVPSLAPPSLLEAMRSNHNLSPEPLVKTGVEASIAWQRMTRTEKAIVYITFALLGMGVLLPFNSIITPAEYFRSSFAKTPYADTFSSWIVASYNVASILFGLHATATGGFDSSSPSQRIITSSLIVMFCIFCFVVSTTINLASSDGIAHPVQYFYFTLALGCLLSSATAYFQNAVVALSTAFGANGGFMGSMLAGQGIVGVGISLFGILSAWSQQGKLSAPDTPIAEVELDAAVGIASAATVFFTMSMLLMLLVLLVFVRLSRSDLYAQVMAKQIASMDKIQDVDVDVDDDDDALEQNFEDSASYSHNRMAQSWHSERSISHPHYQSILKTIPGFHLLSSISRNSLLKLAAVQSKIAWDCFAVAFVFTITLSLFPALTSSIQSVYSDANNGEPTSFAAKRGIQFDLTSPQLFVPFHFLLFNVSDLVGRTLPSLVPRMLLRKRRVLVLSSLARTVFVPIFLACHVVSSSQRTAPIVDHHQPPSSFDSFKSTATATGLAALMQSSDAPFFIAMLLFGLSNGLISTCIMISGPSRSSLINSKGASQGPLAAALLSFWLCVGLAAGSGLSFLTVRE